MSYKKKNILLIAGAFLFSIIIYYYAIEKTIDVINGCIEFKDQLKIAENAPQKHLDLIQKLDKVKGLLGNGGKFGVDVQQVLLEKISKFCSENNIILKDFPRPVTVQEQDFIVETNIIVVEGDFIKLLKLVYQLEQIQRTGKVAAVHFIAKEDLKTKRLMLTASLYLQNIKKS